MTFKTSTAVLALAAAILGPPVAQAFTGVGGCSGLPEYYRALGALQGGMESACAMTVDQARHILSAYGGVPGVEPSAVPPPRAGSHRRRMPAQ